MIRTLLFHNHLRHCVFHSSLYENVKIFPTIDLKKVLTESRHAIQSLVWATTNNKPGRRLLRYCWSDDIFMTFNIDTLEIRGYLEGRNEVRWRPVQEVSLTPPCSTLKSSGSKRAVEESTCNIVGTFRRPPQWFGSRGIGPSLPLCGSGNFFIGNPVCFFSSTFMTWIKLGEIGNVARILQFSPP